MIESRMNSFDVVQDRATPSSRMPFGSNKQMQVKDRSFDVDDLYGDDEQPDPVQLWLAEQNPLAQEQWENAQALVALPEQYSAVYQQLADTHYR